MKKYYKISNIDTDNNDFIKLCPFIECQKTEFHDSKLNSPFNSIHGYLLRIFRTNSSYTSCPSTLVIRNAHIYVEKYGSRTLRDLGLYTAKDLKNQFRGTIYFSLDKDEKEIMTHAMTSFDISDSLRSILEFANFKKSFLNKKNSVRLDLIAEINYRKKIYNDKRYYSDLYNYLSDEERLLLEAEINV